MQNQDHLRLIEQYFESSRHLPKILNTERLIHILVQLRALGWSKVTACDEKFDQITLSYKEVDEQFEDKAVFHLQVKIPEGFPLTGPICTDELPTTFSLPNYNWLPKITTLKDLYLIFVERIQTLTPLRRSLRDLDCNCQVLDPAVSSVKVPFRRVLVEDGISLQITFKENSDFTKLPEILFLGLENKLQRLKKNLMNRSDLYDPDVSIVRNLEHILKVELPGPQQNKGNPHDGLDCSVCFNYDLNGLPPSRVCECGAQFHIDCLYEWLRSVPENLRTLQTLFGKCPCCERSIHCPVPML